MLTLIKTTKNDYYPGHKIVCKKAIGSFIEGEKYHCAIQKCSGKKFKDIEDRVGSTEDRLMIFTISGSSAYAIGKKTILDDCFEYVY